MKIIILGGFLGSGKTTVLMQLASYLQKNTSSSSDTPVVILENEISKTGVDNQLLSQNNFLVENIFNGCICCSSTAPFQDSVKKIEKTYHPAWLLIEATGMAYPDQIRKTLLEKTGFHASVFALADANRWHRVRRAMPDFVNSQLMDADVVLLTKTDLADESMIDEAEKDIHLLSPDALLFRINALIRQEDLFWKKVLSADKVPKYLRIHYKNRDAENDVFPEEKIEISTRDQAVIGNITLCLPLPYEEARNTITKILTQIAEDIEREGGFVGHLKAYLRQENKSAMISITETGDAQVKELSEIRTYLENVNIVFGIDQAALLKILKNHYQQWIVSDSLQHK